MKNKPSLLAIAALCALSFAGCNNTLRQDMANQPRQNPLSPSDFFPDGRSERPVGENTVGTGAIQEDWRRGGWGIVACMRGLQLSRNAPVGQLPEELREKLMSGGTAK